MVQFLCNLVYFPGSHSLHGIAVILFFVGQLLAILSIPVTLLFLIILIASWIKRKKLLKPQLYLIPFALSFSILFTQEKMQAFARNYAINNASNFIDQAEHCYKKEGIYPVNISNYDIDLPEDGIIGITEYKYDTYPGHFKLSFNQPIILMYNFEIVSYNSLGQEEAEGALRTVHKTKYPNWTYYLFD